MSRLNLFFLLFLGLSLLACKRELAPSLNLNWDYQPAQLGSTWIYQLDSIVYNEYENRIDTFKLQWRETLLAQDQDGLEQNRWIVQREERRDSHLPWQFKQRLIWQFQGPNFEVQEDNQRILKLQLPIKTNHQWDGLRYLNRNRAYEIQGSNMLIFKDWPNFRYTQTNLNHQGFEEVCAVLLSDQNSLIERRYAIEYYAKNIGLIEREWWILDTQCRGDLNNCIGIDWAIKAEKGFIIKQKLIHYAE